jgi:undecaprenyl-diphosphatase
MFPADQHLEILINRVWTAPWADRLLAFVSDFGAWKIWLLLLVILAVVLGNFRLRAAILAAGLAIGFSDGIAVNLLKYTVARPRPSQVEPGVRMVALGPAPCGAPKIAGLLSEPMISFPHGTEEPEVPGQLAAEGVTGKSFPSGHAANNMAVATVLILFFGSRGALYLLFALLIGYARIYTGAHWPFDVLGGFLLGLIGGILAVNLVEILWRRFGPRLVPTLALRYPSLLRSS